MKKCLVVQKYGSSSRRYSIPMNGSSFSWSWSRSSSMLTAARRVSYRECQKNHAANIGGYAVDGCGEFMAAGEDGTTDALTCAACGCHRNFHKKEVEIHTSGSSES